MFVVDILTHVDPSLFKPSDRPRWRVHLRDTHLPLDLELDPDYEGRDYGQADDTDD